MLNITRRRGERIVVGDDIFVSVLEVSGQSVRLGIDAPRSVRVYREELWLEIKAENEAAVQAAAGATLPQGAIPELEPKAAPGEVQQSKTRQGEGQQGKTQNGEGQQGEAQNGEAQNGEGSPPAPEGSPDDSR